ncbi:MAG TPA: hypothetical protein VF444_14020 [Pseudonocardiaceae bacterium]
MLLTDSPATGTGDSQRTGGPPSGAPATLIAQLRGYAATTPGRLSSALIGLVVLSLLTGVVGLLSVQGNASSVDDLAHHREPVSYAAQEIYGSLSDADATAASAFLSGAIEPTQLRARFNADIQRAGSALAVAAADAGDTTGSGPIAQLAAGIPVYTGLIDRASANNESGLPVGSAYLREADNLMQKTLLPAAQKLYQDDVQSVAQAQDDATSFPWVATVLMIALIVVLVITQRYLRQRTNRMFNVGLLVASGAVVLVVLWSAVGLITETVYVDGGQSSGTRQAQQLAQARIEASQARTDELLALVARGGVDYGSEFTKLANDIGGKDGTGGLLGQARRDPADDTMAGQLDKAIANAKTWFADEQQTVKVNNSGNYAVAVDTALSTAPTGEATVYDHLDDNLAGAISQGRTDFIRQTETGGAWLTALPEGVLVLCLVAGAGSSLGIWRRLREYR